MVNTRLVKSIFCNACLKMFLIQNYWGWARDPPTPPPPPSPPYCACISTCLQVLKIQQT